MIIIRYLQILFAILILSGLLPTGIALADSLYIGDGGDNTVKRFDARTGAFEVQFVQSTNPNLTGPRGLIFVNGNPPNLLLVNQNDGTSKTGDIFIYNGDTGAFI